jgi:hypothetical protein
VERACCIKTIAGINTTIVKVFENNKKIMNLIVLILNELKKMRKIFSKNACGNRNSCIFAPAFEKQSSLKS